MFISAPQKKIPLFNAGKYLICDGGGNPLVITYGMDGLSGPEPKEGERTFCLYGRITFRPTAILENLLKLLRCIKIYSVSQKGIRWIRVQGRFFEFTMVIPMEGFLLHFKN
jgi:hypothetical protein